MTRQWKAACRARGLGGALARADQLYGVLRTQQLKALSPSAKCKVQVQSASARASARASASGGQRLDRNGKSNVIDVWLAGWSGSGLGIAAWQPASLDSKLGAAENQAKFVVNLDGDI